MKRFNQFSFLMLFVAFLFFFQQLSASPHISVSDIDFGDVAVGSQVTKILTITNSGTDMLYISGTNYFEMNNPWAFDNIAFVFDGIGLAAGSSTDFDIIFSPTEEIDYADVLILYSNASPNNPNHKSTSNFTGRGTSCQIKVEDYNWGRFRAALPRYETLDYINIEPYPNDDDVFTINNPCSKIILLSNIQVVSDNLDVFINASELTQLVNTNLAGYSKTTHPILFYPKSEGEFSLEITVTTGDVQKVATIRGTGIYPEVQSADVDFGTFDTSLDFMVKEAYFQNNVVQISSYEYLDDLTIYDFEIVSGSATFNEAELNDPVYGSPVFFIDKSVINYPYKLLTTSLDLNIPIKLKPLNAGTYNAQIRTKSDAHTEAIVNIVATVTTSIQDNQINKQVTIFPNPVSELLYISTETIIVNTELTDILGRTVFQQSGNVEQISTAGLAQGLYLLKLFTAGGEVLTDKVVVR